ncbi:glycosyltransferase [Phormidium sp. LEGE 05292]|uniref:glycosyltransferase family 2 protein n=1 Tax=[Phormidium] sp. LEGE 05292 TaxID=767427 RepID=UPI0018812943|nr:glycosyltransferase [Phormidium sp. LEGE 05292]MBE9228317.1 glycosyltransferase [Phormidium sp. LEGE 05292]
MLSILMPVYNAKQYLAETIESVLSQTYKEFELIIINDSSTDNSLEIIKSYAEKDRRIKVFSHQSNQGIVSTLNWGLDLAENELIVRIDADDLMLPIRLERQVAFMMEHPDVAVASSYVYYIDQKGRLIGNYQPKYITKAAVDEAFQKNELISFHHPAVIMRKSVVQEFGGYRQDLELAQDLDLWNRIVEKYPVLVQPEFLTKYRIHGSSISVRKVGLSLTTIRFIQECVDRRRRGEEEINWEEFLTIESQYPLLKRLNKKREELGKTYYKSAVIEFSMKRFHLLVLSLLLAFSLCPSYTFTQVMSKSKRKTF